LKGITKGGDVMSNKERTELFRTEPDPINLLEKPEAEVTLRDRIPAPGDYYFVPGTNQIRPAILEKQRQIAQGRY